MMAFDDVPLMLAPRSMSADWTLLPSSLPVPGVGVLPVNSFLMTGVEPVLVDTGLAALADDYLTALRTQLDLHSLRWIWLSHLDPDHTGNLRAGLVAWSTIDAPWLAYMQATQMTARFDEMSRMAPSQVLSSHLPPIKGNAEKLACWLLQSPGLRKAA